MDATSLPEDADGIEYPRLDMSALVALRRESERVMLTAPACGPDAYSTAVKVCTRVDTELYDRSWSSMRAMLWTEAENTRAIARAEQNDVAILPGIVEERDNATVAIDAVVRAVDAINRRRVH